MSKDRLLGMISTLVVSAIGAGFLWVQAIGTRVALIEDDLTETVDVMMVLHPRGPAASLAVEPLFFTDDKEKQHEERQRALKELRAQMVEPPPGDADDSAGGSPRPLQEPPQES